MQRSYIQNMREETWQALNLPWIKMNTDDTRKASSGETTCGGVIRDYGRRWIFGYAKRIGLCSSLKAELWGIYEGLQAAWKLGVRQIQFETDSSEAVKLIRDNPGN
ncbi:hypothetical protein F3Y22_tig00000477pilonHSYRG00219 [Hibiscus syriacus]|uniref:RNase H type-1 domain-containing protein n=1 Tax=Hibiscus syriacus TaxID=106335 RepID=A0A6A3D591_HIBSY|nr:hypothetical protein F3Y22_tig00000477pilonHSYRG00219 [Hibiscus syriacus]